MRFEITYANGSKVIVDVENKAILDWLDSRAKGAAVEITHKTELGRGAPTGAKIVP